MSNKKSLEEILKEKIENNEIFDTIKVLKNEIRKIFINKITEKNKNFIYTDIMQLANNIEKFLTNEEINIFKKYFIILHEQNYELYEIDCLVDIYNKLKRENNNVKI